MKLVFASVHCNHSPQAFPLAAATLAAQIFSQIKVQLIDLYLDDPPSPSVEFILENAPDILGFSVYLWNVERVKELAARIHDRAPEILLIAGGPEITADPDTFDPDNVFTALFSGEGEVTLKRFLVSLQNKKTDRGTISRKIFTQSVPLDVSTLSSPFLEGITNISRYNGILWELSRGCIFNCSFCFESRGIRKVRDFPFERIEKELNIFIEKGVSQIFVLDPTFNLDPERAKKLLRLFSKKAAHIHFTFEIRSEFLDREMAELFALLTCSVQIGLQSIHKNVLKKIHRYFNRDDFYHKILLLHEAGVVYGFDLIYGLPGDSYRGFCESLDYALSLRPNHLDIFPLAVLKGTELYDTAEEYGLSWKKEKPYTVCHTPHFSRTDMVKAEKLASACTFFYNKGEAVPWFSLFLEALDTSPSSLLTEFTEYLEKKGQAASPSETISLLERADILADFMNKQFAKKSLKKEGLISSDIIRWFAGVSSLNSTEEETSLFLDFTFNIEELVKNITMGIDTIEEITFFTTMAPCQGELYKTGGEVFTRIIETYNHL